MVDDDVLAGRKKKGKEERLEERQKEIERGGGWSSLQMAN